MRDTDFYQQILGLEEPWTVTRVDLDVTEQRVDIWVDHGTGIKWPCPKCGAPLTCRDHADERVWRHLDTCQFQTLLHARIPRVECPDHGVAQVRVPWAEPRSRFTRLFERLAIDVLTQCATISGARRLLRLSWDEAWGIMERAVARGRGRKQAEPIRHLGIDEKAFRKGHSYMTVVCDLGRGTVEHVAEGRRQESLEACLAAMSEEQRAGVEAVAMDMWQPYVAATEACIPDATEKIVFDRFHIMQHMGGAVDRVRRQENRALVKGGDDTLKGTKYVWLYSEENLPDRLRPTLEALRDSALKVARAWAIKESLRDLWTYRRKGWARRFVKSWLSWASRSHLAPVVRVARMIRRHLANILTFFDHRVTNAVAEGLNSKIMSIKRRCGGFRNRENFKTAILFHCGGLDLYPR